MTAQLISEAVKNWAFVAERTHELSAEIEYSAHKAEAMALALRLAMSLLERGIPWDELPRFLQEAELIPPDADYWSTKLLDEAIKESALAANAVYERSLSFTEAQG